MTTTQLTNYADLILWCVEGFEEKNVYVQTETCHRDLACAIAERAYGAGARLVCVDYEDPAITAARIRHADEDGLVAFAEYQKTKADELASDDWTRVRIAGQAEPDILSGMDTARVGAYMAAARVLVEKIRLRFSRFEASWVGVLMPTQALASKAFPELSAQEAFRRYEEAIIDVLQLDGDPVRYWKQQFSGLITRRDAFNQMEIDELQFQGPGTDLRIGLHEGGEFMAAEQLLPSGRVARVNMPSCEIFTTPDARRTNGRVRTTRAFQSTSAPGQTVHNAWFEFRDGKVVDFGADQGSEILGRVLEMDSRAAYLGEVALVSVDSPVARQEITFGHMLYDENAACHIALGSGFPRIVPGASELSREEQIERGVNNSLVHDDMMIGSREVDVTARTKGGDEIPIIRNGLFVV